MWFPNDLGKLYRNNSRHHLQQTVKPQLFKLRRACLLLIRSKYSYQEAEYSPVSNIRHPIDHFYQLLDSNKEGKTQVINWTHNRSVCTMGLEHLTPTLACLLTSLILIPLVELTQAGLTGSYVRTNGLSSDMPLDSDVFRLPTGYNAPQQVCFCFLCCFYFNCFSWILLLLFVAYSTV